MSETKRRAAKLPEVGQWPDRIAPWMLLAGAVLTTIGFLMAFFYAGPVNGAAVDGVELIGGQMVSSKLLLSQKIFYFHMPVAITSFVVCTMATGEMWTRFEWGVWWTWEPRLTTYLILMLVVIAYFVLRSAIDEPERRATYAAVISVIALVDVPICYMVTRLIPSSIHPVVLREGGMSADMGMTVAVVMAGMCMVGFGLYRLRFRQTRLAQRVEAVKEQLED